MERSRAAGRGFTLIELLVVIAIIGLLSSVILASLNTARSKGNDAQRRSNLLEVQKALELYAADHNGQYPNSGGNWNSSCSGWTQTTQNNGVPGLVPTYIGALPSDSEVNAAANTCCYLYYSGGGTTDYKYLFYNCPTSQACYGGTESSSGALADPARPTQACAIYTTGAAGW